MWKDFKEFALRGNVIDLAVGVIIGTAFSRIVNSLVNDILMPVVGIFLGGVDFSSLSVTVGNAVILWGSFVQAIVDFLIVALIVFLTVRALNRSKREQPAPAPTTKDCPQCFTSIPIKARRCPNCTSEL